MTQHQNDYTVSDWNRDAVMDFLKLARPYTCFGSSIFDITETQAKLKQYQKTLRLPLSLHAFTVYCLSRAVIKHPQMLSYRYKNKIITFKDANICTTVLKKTETGDKRLSLHVFRAAQDKSLAEIQWEMRRAMKEVYVPPPSKMPFFMQRLVKKRITRKMFYNPVLLNQHIGNVMLTNTNSPGLKSLFGVTSFSPCTVTMLTGSIEKHYVLSKEGKTEEKRLLNVTGAGDHAMIDGYDLSCIMTTVAELFETAAGIDELFLSEMKTLQYKHT
ncbi:MAG: 2-oxo acid dehydrogenase subunit E2 [Proteobacteria bacterium]|nr:2-oxo acid dehydrogenase subunit E2 [Pseudomonadota bacterium]